MVAGADVPGTVVAGALAFGAGDSGTAGAAVVGAVVAGAVAGAGAGLPNVSSRTDFGTCVRVDMICRTNDRPRKIPAHHQVALVRIVPAWRMPMKASGEELAPPKFAASPLPFPDCSRIAAIRTKASITRSTRRKL